jgi:hypothetical protein
MTLDVYLDRIAPCLVLCYFFLSAATHLEKSYGDQIESLDWLTMKSSARRL